MSFVTLLHVILAHCSLLKLGFREQVDILWTLAQ